MEINSKIRTLALISLYSLPDRQLLEDSYATLFVCRYRGDDALVVVDAKEILAVISMAPLPLKPEEAAEEGADEKYGDLYYCGEKPGLDVMHLTGIVETDDDSQDNDMDVD
jgi:hypothetical protein